MADLLLAPLAPDLYEYMRHQRGLTIDRVKEGLRIMANLAL